MRQQKNMEPSREKSTSVVIPLAYKNSRILIGLRLPIYHTFIQIKKGFRKIQIDLTGKRVAMDRLTP